MQTLRVRVQNRVLETPKIIRLELVSTDGQSLPEFSAGAHIDVHLASGLIRQYSLTNSARDTSRYILGVLLDPGSRGGSDGMHRLQAGDCLDISPPKNHFALQPNNRTVLVAGGIGITPLLSMAEQLLEAGSEFDMHVCTKSRELTPFINRLLAADLVPHVHLHHTGGDPLKRVDFLQLLESVPPDAHLYVCGPQEFIDTVLGAARVIGLDETHLHREYFSAAPPATSSATERSFSVTLGSSGLQFEIPHDQTITQVLRQEGIEIPVSCEQGVCGTCITRVLAGIPDHRDMYLTDSEHMANDQMTPCCSRSLTASLTLDI